MFQKFWYWLTTSSANPSKISLTIRAGAPMVITIIVFLTGLNPDDLSPVVDAIVKTIEALILAGSSVGFLIGLVRKLWTTYKGEHPVSE